MSDQVAETPVGFSPLEKSLTPEFLADFPNYVDGLVRSDPGGFVHTPTYADNFDNYRNFTVRTDDVWVVTFPKCGTTWAQEMVWMITNDCDTETAKKDLNSRSPFLEFNALVQGKNERKKLVPLEQIDEMPSPRVIKSHLPFRFLPPRLVDTCKVVYVARNPKDVIVSYFHHHQFINSVPFQGDIEKFSDYFMNDEVYYAPFFGHILEAWAKKDHPNVLFLFYEDMKKNLRGEIEKVCAFLNKNLSEEQLQMLTKHLHFSSMSQNEAVNMEPLKRLGIMPKEGNFIRKGKTGDWMNHFSPELNQRIDQWIKKNMEGSDLKFTMELDHQS